MCICICSLKVFLVGKDRQRCCTGIVTVFTQRRTAPWPWLMRPPWFCRKHVDVSGLLEGEGWFPSDCLVFRMVFELVSLGDILTSCLGGGSTWNKEGKKREGLAPPWLSVLLMGSYV